jgi:cytochrome c oxidase cbb3-type subunit 2
MRRTDAGFAGPGVIALGTLVLVGLALFAGVILPITDPANRADAKGVPRSYNALALQGRTLYIREGCFTCHTQMVRSAFADSALGPRPSQAGDYGNEAPNLLGSMRVGPDLTCVGDDDSMDASWHVRHLRMPRAVREHSMMPSYSYLSPRELRALAAYLLSLTCEG